MTNQSTSTRVEAANIINIDKSLNGCDNKQYLIELITIIIEAAKALASKVIWYGLNVEVYVVCKSKH
jgi:hypothetical protein